MSDSLGGGLVEHPPIPGQAWSPVLQGTPAQSQMLRVIGDVASIGMLHRIWKKDALETLQYEELMK